jgi:hypothetical protein
MFSRIVHLLAILSMLSACAQPGPGGHPTVTHDQPAQRVETKRQHADASGSSIRKARYGHRHADHHHHHGPTPEEEYAATIALLISAQIFACAFVVIILDGHCDFYVSTGYHHY